MSLAGLWFILVLFRTLLNQHRIYTRLSQVSVDFTLCLISKPTPLLFYFTSQYLKLYRWMTPWKQQTRGDSRHDLGYKSWKKKHYVTLKCMWKSLRPLANMYLSDLWLAAYWLWWYLKLTSCIYLIYVYLKKLTLQRLHNNQLLDKQFFGSMESFADFFSQRKFSKEFRNNLQ